MQPRLKISFRERKNIFDLVFTEISVYPIVYSRKREDYKEANKANGDSLFKTVSMVKMYNPTPFSPINLKNPLGVLFHNS